MAENDIHMPILFVGHGNPMNAIEDSTYSRGWEQIATEIPRPKAVLCISAHWETEGPAVIGNESPRTIHDFGGFPKALYEVEYPAPGDPALAARVQDLLGGSDAITLYTEWGLDHGTWSVLRRMYPDASVPVIQLSLDITLSFPQHYQFGKLLAPLRDEGILIVGSGNIVHSFYHADPRSNAVPQPWVGEFVEFIKEAVQDMRHERIQDPFPLGRSARNAINSAEHYKPLLYVAGLQEHGESVTFYNDGVDMAAFSMLCVKIG
jgi:4,5-DOPA dioxygenase extradiol